MNGYNGGMNHDPTCEIVHQCNVNIFIKFFEVCVCACLSEREGIDISFKSR